LDESLTQPPSDKSNVNEWAANIINKAVKKSEYQATEIVNKVKEEDLRQFMFCVCVTMDIWRFIPQLDPLI